MAEGTRMKTLEENLKRLKALVQKQVEINEQWVNSTNRSMNDANRDEQRTRLEDDHSCLEENRVCMDLMQKITEHRFEFPIDAVENLFKDRDQDRSEAVGGVNLGVQSSAFEAKSTPVMSIRSRLSEARPLVPERIVPESFSTETTSMVTKQTEGNGRNSRLELADWDFLVLDDSLGVKNLELHPSMVDDSVGSKNFEFMNAQEVFDKLLEKKFAEMPDFVEFLGILGDSYGSSSFVFDPGKRNAFSSHIEFGLREISKGVDISFASRATTAAYQMLEKMPRNEVALVGSSFHYSLRSIDSPSLFAFDPGKSKEFSICTGWVEMPIASFLVHILVLCTAASCEAWLLVVTDVI